MSLRRITKIEKQTKRDRYNIYLDGSYEFSLASSVSGALDEGQEISDEQIRELIKKDDTSKAYNRAILILSYRANTEAELKRKLSKNFDVEIIQEVISKLIKQGLVNDEEFAERYVEQSKKGKKIVKLELMKKGIDRELAEKQVCLKDEQTEMRNASKLAQKIAKRFDKEDTQTIKKKIYEGLTRQGFSYDIYKEILKDLS